MKNENKFLVICFICLMMFVSTISNAQDIKLKINKTSIENMMNAFIKSKYFSYGTTDLGGFVRYYSLKIQSASFNIQPGNIFSILFTVDWVANFNLVIFDFDYVEHNKNVTLTGTIQLHTLASGYKIVFVPQSISSSSGGIFASVIYFAQSGILAKLPEMSINMNQPLLPGIIGQYFTSATPTLTSSTNGVELSLTLKAGPRYITAYNDVNQTINIGIMFLILLKIQIGSFINSIPQIDVQNFNYTID